MKKYFLVVIILVLSACTSLQEVSRDSKEYHSKGFVKIRGSKQYVTINTENTDKPVLLYLHGGPGGAQTPVLSPYFKELEKDYIVVLWDQRGAGKSFNGLILPRHQTIDSFVEDTKEVTKYLENKFDKEKIFLVGNSWGSLLGMETIKKYPELYYAYVGTGQVVDMKKNYEISYELLLQKSIEDKNQEMKKKLESINGNKIRIGKFGFLNFSAQKFKRILNKYEYEEMENIVKERLRKKLEKENVDLEYKEKIHQGLKKRKLAYNPTVVNLKMGGLYPKLWNEFRNVNLNNEITKVKVPVYFAEGRNDFHTPYTLLEEYYDVLDAPKKEIVWFEKSGHGAEIQEPEKFAELMRRVQKETLNN